MNVNPQMMNYYFNQGNNNQQFNSQSQYQQGYNNKNFRNQYQNQQFQNRNNQIPNQSYQNKGNQPEVDETSMIQSLKYVTDKYPQLMNFNQINSGIRSKVKDQQSPRFFVIKSFTEEDIHKVIYLNLF